MKKEITHKEYQADVISGANSFRKDTLGYKQISYFGRHLRLFIKTIVTIKYRKLVKFPWNNFENLLIKVQGIKVVETKMSLEAWLKLMHEDKIDYHEQPKHKHGPSRRNGYNLGSNNKLNGLIKNGKVNGVDPRQRWAKGVVLTWCGKKLNTFGDKLEKIFDYRTIMAFQLADIGLKLWLINDLKLKDDYYEWKMLELYASTGQAFANQIELHTGKVRDKKLEALRTKTERKNRKGYNAKGNKQKLSSALRAEAKSAASFGKASINFGRLGGLLGVLADGYATIANFGQYQKMLDDNRERKAEFYNISMITTGISCFGNIALFSGYFFTAGWIPIVGWVLIFIGLGLSLYLWLTFRDDADSPKEHWLERCYWGRMKYAYARFRNDKNEVYLNYKSFDGNHIAEINEIQKILNSYTIEAHWYPRDHSCITHNYKKSIVVDFIIPNWVEDRSELIVNIVGIRKWSASNRIRGDQKVTLFDARSQDSSSYRVFSAHHRIYHKGRPAKPYQIYSKKVKPSATTTIRVFLKPDALEIDVKDLLEVEIEAFYFPFPNGMATPDNREVKLKLKSSEFGFLNPDDWNKKIDSYTYQRNNIKAT